MYKKPIYIYTLTSEKKGIILLSKIIRTLKNLKNGLPGINVNPLTLLLKGDLELSVF